ncbi:hypothetical protein MRX96_058318 [Rhipicephalus microplus]
MFRRRWVVHGGVQCRILYAVTELAARGLSSCLPDHRESRKPASTTREMLSHEAADKKSHVPTTAQRQRRPRSLNPSRRPRDRRRRHPRSGPNGRRRRRTAVGTTTAPKRGEHFLTRTGRRGPLITAPRLPILALSGGQLAASAAVFPNEQTRLFTPYRHQNGRSN